MSNVIERIETFLEIDGISTNALSRKAGIDPGNMAKMLAGKQSITANTLRKIAVASGLNFEWLKYGDGEMFVGDLHNKNISVNQNNTNSNIGSKINDSEVIIKLLALLEEKDRQIAVRDKQITDLIEILKSK